MNPGITPEIAAIERQARAQLKWHEKIKVRLGGYTSTIVYVGTTPYLVEARDRQMQYCHPLVAPGPDEIGEHNHNLGRHRIRLIRGDVYQDLSTIHLMLTRGVLPVQVVECILGTLPEMNQRNAKMLVTGHSCQSGYNEALKLILRTDYENAVRKNRPFRYLFVTEDDVLWPGDALHRLYRAMKAHPELHGISGLCWTKQENGYPMILGDPNTEYPDEYFPQAPQLGGVQPAKAIPLGCTLLDLNIFRDPRWGKTPFFREDCGLDGSPTGRVTVDVWLCHQAGKMGYKFGVDTDLKVGHRDPVTGRIF